MHILLTGARLLLDGSLFDFTDDERHTRLVATGDLLEHALGAAPGTFNFMTSDTSNGS